MAVKTESRTKVAVAKSRAGAKAHVAPASTAHKLHVLLLAVQRIASFEDELCSLVHEATRAREVTSELARELRDLLDRMPAHDYVHDLEAIQLALAPSAPARPVKKPAKKAAAPAKKKLSRGKASARPMESGNTRKKRR